MNLAKTFVIADGDILTELRLDELPRVGEQITWKGGPQGGAWVVQVLRDYRSVRERRCGDGQLTSEYDAIVRVKVIS